MGKTAFLGLFTKKCQMAYWQKWHKIGWRHAKSNATSRQNKRNVTHKSTQRYSKINATLRIKQRNVASKAPLDSGYLLNFRKYFFTTEFKRLRAFHYVREWMPRHFEFLGGCAWQLLHGNSAFSVICDLLFKSINLFSSLSLWFKTNGGFFGGFAAILWFSADFRWICGGDRRALE